MRVVRCVTAHVTAKPVAAGCPRTVSSPVSLRRDLAGGPAPATIRDLVRCPVRPIPYAQSAATRGCRILRRPPPRAGRRRLRQDPCHHGKNLAPDLAPTPGR